MKYYILLISTAIFSKSFSQEVQWAETRNWKIYAVNSNSAFNYPLDSFQSKNSVRMEDSVVISFFTKASIWPITQYPYWMGMYFGSYELYGGRTCKVVFSAYGGFFFDSDSKRYYEVPKVLRKKWTEFLYTNLERVFE